jgi:UDP-N-acetylglucosamine 2-epimerase
MNLCDVVVGNSSSGILEAPLLKRATVNIGDRQRGRARTTSILDVPESSLAIAAAIRRAMSPDFRASLNKLELPGAQVSVAARMKDHLKSVSLDGILMKRFRDRTSAK